MNLYKVTLKGMTYRVSGPAYGLSYVVADNMDDAYNQVKAFLDEKDYGFKSDRELDKVELIADEKGNCGNMLFIAD